ncbi:hypothetical protein [Granulicella arctica]|uniref:Uncharacterized protein n=1 Tax=Granulicella arctica TaxID=940613 RepID=A0A7Y9PFG7_9BACT|nr:hypothetical protein [Granulicella arctica]NYF78952.1 hypothetical protein [Granulicella arctica]
MKIALKLAFVAMLMVFILHWPAKANAYTTCPYGDFNGCMSTLIGGYVGACKSECAEEYSPEYQPAQYDACLNACNSVSSSQVDAFEQECIADGCIP